MGAKPPVKADPSKKEKGGPCGMKKTVNENELPKDRSRGRLQKR